MDKQKVIDHFGGREKAAKKLGYSQPQCVTNWPDPIPDATVKSIIRRMRSARIPVPRWLKVDAKSDGG